MREFKFEVVVGAENAGQAAAIMQERLGFDEDLSELGIGEYTLEWESKWENLP